MTVKTEYFRGDIYKNDKNAELRCWPSPIRNDSENIFSLIFCTFQGTREEWLKVYDIAGLICCFGGLVYAFLGTSELQPWAKPKKTIQLKNSTSIEPKSQERPIRPAALLRLRSTSHLVKSTLKHL